MDCAVLRWADVRRWVRTCMIVLMSTRRNLHHHHPSPHPSHTTITPSPSPTHHPRFHPSHTTITPHTPMQPPTANDRLHMINIYIQITSTSLKMVVLTPVCRARRNWNRACCAGSRRSSFFTLSCCLSVWQMSAKTSHQRVAC